jgi:hypothetical protein
MSTALDDILKDERATEPKAEAPEAEPRADERPRDERGKFVAKEKGAEPESSAAKAEETPGEEAASSPSTGEPAAPPAAKDEARTVPLSALEDERRKRQAKDEELAQVRAELAKARNPRPDDLDDPDGAKRWDENDRLNERVNLSYEMAREAIADFDAVMEAWPALLQAEPALYDAAIKARNPAKYAYDAVRRHKVLQEVGTDPAAYRAKVEAEIRQAMEAEAATAADAAQKTQTRDSLPTSLAGQRSVTSRSSGPQFAGPTPLDKLLPG